MWLKTNVETMFQAHADRDNYNADKAGLFYNLLPNRILSMKREHCTGRKASKQRVTVLFCANLDGSEKHRLFVIGKYVRPRCF